jgi:hypothetical protein
MKNAAFWDVTPYGSCYIRRFGGMYRLIFKVERIRELVTTLGVTGKMNQVVFDHRS